MKRFLIFGMLILWAAVTHAQVKTLTAEECVQIALENNADLNVSRFFLNAPYDETQLVILVVMIL